MAAKGKPAGGKVLKKGIGARMPVKRSINLVLVDENKINPLEAVLGIILIVALQYLEDVIAFIWRLTSTASAQSPLTDTMLKITGVALITELTVLISSDAGNSSLGKAVEILGNAAILFLAIPLFETFLTMIQEMMGLL